MKILHLMKDYKPVIGGSVVRNSNMIDNYHKQYLDDELYLLNLDGSEFQYESVEDGVKVIREISLINLIKTARKIIKREKIDVIHAHNFRFLYAAYISRLFLAPKPQIVLEIHAMYNMCFWKEILSNYLMRRTGKIIVLAECARQYLIEKRGIKDEQITVIRNGIDEFVQSQKLHDKNFENAILQLKKRHIIVAYTGSFIEWQGVRFLADNFDIILEKCEKTAIVMVGNGPDFDYVKNKGKESMFNDRILIHCGISKPETIELYKYIDILLIPRIKNLSTNTAVPLKAIEAMRYEKCILSSNDKGLLEVLNETNSLNFESEKIDSLINHLIDLQDNDELRKLLSSQAAISAKKLFLTWKEASKMVNYLYAGDLK